MVVEPGDGLSAMYVSLDMPAATTAVDKVLELRHVPTIGMPAALTAVARVVEPAVGFTTMYQLDMNRWYDTAADTTLQQTCNDSPLSLPW